MNWVDIAIVFLLLTFAVEGYKKSFVGEFLNFLSFLLALLISLRFYNLLAEIFQANSNLPHSLTNVLGFITVWFLVELVLFLIIRLTLRRSNLIDHIDRRLSYLSFIPAFLRGVIFISILLVLMGIFPLQPKIKLAVEGSQLGSFLLSKTSQLEAPLKQVFGGISSDTLTFFTVKPETDENINLGFTLNEFQARENLEMQMINLVNRERSKEGLQTVEFSSKLRNVARDHSADMFKRGYFSHYSPENESVAARAGRVKVDYSIIGENLAYAPDLNLAHSGLMNSPGHRANILSPEFNKIGIGVMDGGVYGLMITQVFTN